MIAFIALFWVFAETLQLVARFESHISTSRSRISRG